MPSNGENMERFAHDVCVLVLEKFGIFKTPDDTRKQNKYLHHDFLPRMSKSVVSFAFWIRSDFKNALEDRCKISNLDNNEIKWIFNGYLVLNDKCSKKHWTEKVCISLALCTEYVQFAKTKDFSVSLNKLVVGWGEYFEKHLKAYFEENHGFIKLYNYLEISQIDLLDKFQEAFISKHCIPYGAIECTEEVAKECIEKHKFNISLKDTVFGIKKLEYLKECSFGKMEEVKSNNQPNTDLLAESEPLEQGRNSDERKESKPEACFGQNDSEDSRFHSTENDVKASQDVDSEESDSEISKNSLLGIPPHEETLRDIDPFFVENIQSPPKAGPSSKSPERKSAAIDKPSSSSNSSDSESSSDRASQSPSIPPNNELTVRISYCQPSPELLENVDQIISKLEEDMAALKALLYRHGLLSNKSGRRGHRAKVKTSKNKKPPPGPEGLI